MTEERRALLIANPHAGRGGARRARAIARFRERLLERGLKVEVRQTRARGDACQLAARAAHEGAQEVIVSGGDGTINEALQGLVGTNARLAIWPAGTANVLARELRLPFNAEQAADVIARGEAKRLRVGCAINETTGERRYFFLMAGIGLDASIVRRAPLRLKKRFGEAAFWYAGLEHLARWEPRPFEVEIEGQIYSATFAAIGKAAHYGGGLSITPRARLEEPEFEICLVSSRSRLRYLHLLTHALRGGASENVSGMRFIRAKRARATGDALVQADGELIGRLPMTFEIVPEAVEVVAP